MVTFRDGYGPTAEAEKPTPEEIAQKHISLADCAISSASMKVENAQASLNELKANFKKSSRLSVGVFSLSLILGGAAYHFGTAEPEKNQSTIQSLQQKADARCVEVGKVQKLSGAEHETCSKVTYLEELKSEQQKNMIGLVGTVVGMLGAISLSVRFEKQAREKKPKLGMKEIDLRLSEAELSNAYGRHAMANEIYRDLNNNK